MASAVLVMLMHFRFLKSWIESSPNSNSTKTAQIGMENKLFKSLLTIKTLFIFTEFGLAYTVYTLQTPVCHLPISFSVVVWWMVNLYIANDCAFTSIKARLSIPKALQHINIFSRFYSKNDDDDDVALYNCEVRKEFEK